MRSSLAARVVVCLLAAAASLEIISAQAAKTSIRFSPADPITVDEDTVADASKFAEVELSEGFDLISNQFGSPGDRTPMRAVNVNTIDEVPDSSWFTNRIGARPITIDELRRGPVAGPAPTAVARAIVSAIEHHRPLLVFPAWYGPVLWLTQARAPVTT